MLPSSFGSTPHPWMMPSDVEQGDASARTGRHGQNVVAHRIEEVDDCNGIAHGLEREADERVREAGKRLGNVERHEHGHQVHRVGVGRRHS